MKKFILIATLALTTSAFAAPTLPETASFIQRMVNVYTYTEEGYVSYKLSFSPGSECRPQLEVIWGARNYNSSVSKYEIHLDRVVSVNEYGLSVNLSGPRVAEEVNCMKKGSTIKNCSNPMARERLDIPMLTDAYQLKLYKALRHATELCRVPDLF